MGDIKDPHEFTEWKPMVRSGSEYPLMLNSEFVVVPIEAAPDVVLVPGPLGRRRRIKPLLERRPERVSTPTAQQPWETIQAGVET